MATRNRLVRDSLSVIRIDEAEYRRARAHRVERRTEDHSLYRSLTVTAQKDDSVLSQFYGQAERAISNG